VSAGATPGAHTRLYALLGDPLSHSLSPLLHNAAIHAEGLDAVYLALRCTSSDCERLLLGIARARGGGNVTVPHKELAARLVERPSAAVRRTGACNTFWLEQGEVYGDNTDVAGLRSALHTFIGKLAGARVALIGAGGSARAAVAALADEQVERIDVIARTPTRVAALQTIARDTRTTVAAAELPFWHGYDLVINATPLGLRDDDPLPMPIEQLRGANAVLDLVYGPNGTRWSTAAAAAGIRALDGKEMLLQQAAASFQLWFNRPAPREVMRQALHTAVSHR
jgi:shikimate dehydrogenase